jgi:hypothetical protein
MGGRVIAMPAIPMTTGGIVPLVTKAEPCENLVPHYRPSLGCLPRSQVFGNLLELPDLGALFACYRASRRLEAMVDVVVNKGALRLGECIGISV